MANEASESILRQLLLSNDDNDHDQGSLERKRKLKSDNEEAEKRAKFVHDSSETGSTSVNMEESFPGQILATSPTVSQALQNPNDQEEPQQNQEPENLGFVFNANEMNLDFDEMDPASFSPMSSEEDELPVTHEMEIHYLQQLRDSLIQDIEIGLPPLH